MKHTTVRINEQTWERMRRRVGAINAAGGSSNVSAYATQAIEQRLKREKAPKLDGDNPANP
jgi:hypothetical protein